MWPRRADLSLDRSRAASTRVPQRVCSREYLWTRACALTYARSAHFRSACLQARLGCARADASERTMQVSARGRAFTRARSRFHSGARGRGAVRVRLNAQGDRLGVCVTQLDAKALERGIACTPGYIQTMDCVLMAVRARRSVASRSLLPLLQTRAC
eukprot:6191790-Pleurochrysis_carterae.AAC.1